MSKLLSEEKPFSVLIKVWEIYIFSLSSGVSSKSMHFWWSSFSKK